MLDLDDVTFRTARYWARRASNWFKLGGFILLKSSDRCYHAVFDRPVTWAENMGVVAWVALQSRNEGLTRWLLMQCIKGASTLRVGPKGEKPPPRIVYREGSEDQQVEGFLEYRRVIKRIIRKLSDSPNLFLCSI